jgi:hypothetical protein
VHNIEIPIFVSSTYAHTHVSTTMTRLNIQRSTFNIAYHHISTFKHHHHCLQRCDLTTCQTIPAEALTPISVRFIATNTSDDNHNTHDSWFKVNQPTTCQPLTTVPQDTDGRQLLLLSPFNNHATCCATICWTVSCVSCILSSLSCLESYVLCSRFA